MSVFLRLSSLAMRGMVSGACEYAGLGEGGTNAVQSVVSFLAERFHDQSQRLERALREANRRAWRALEMALQADGLMKRLAGLFTGTEDKAFAAQVKQFLDATPLPEMGDFRTRCLKELVAARGKFLAGKYDAQELARHTGNFSRFADPAKALEAEWAVCSALAEEVRRDGLEALHWLLSQRPDRGMPLLVMAARFFFRRAVEEDAELHRGLTFAKLEAIASGQQAGFQALEQAFRLGEQKLEQVLGGVLQLNEAMLGMDAKLDALRAEILDNLTTLKMARTEVKPAHSFSLRDDREKRVVKALLERFRSLPESQRNDYPALINGLAKLGFASGDFGESATQFRRVAILVGDPLAAAEARHSAHLAALGAGDLEVALIELREAVRLDRRWTPFPFDKYAPERILGAGGFGTAFLCRHQWMGGPVVVKTLQSEAGLAEAQTLRRLDHPGIIRITDAQGGERPYLVMDYFDGKDLSKLAPLPVADAVAIGKKVAEALQAAHANGILHRDVKPGNILARKEKEWIVRVIDFGLAQHQDTADAAIAGTLDYAAPEQLGRLPGGARPASDVYGWGRTMCFALFGTASPHFRHWGQLPRELGDLLGDCVEERPEKRPRDFGAVLSRLGAGSWRATLDEFCEETRRFWLSGKANGFAPNYQRIAQGQRVADFLRDIRGLASLLPGFVRGEALVGTGDTMCLTNYRMAVTLPGGRVLIVPLHELEGYEFQVHEVAFRTRRSSFRFRGAELEGLWFPTQAFIDGVLALAEWRALPPKALVLLGE